jgi:hypothetical protein
MSIATIATFLWQIDGPDARLTKFRKPWKQEISGAASHTRDQFRITNKDAFENVANLSRA